MMRTAKKTEVDPVAFLRLTGAAAFATDENGLILGWNPAMEGLLGHSAKDVVGKRCWEIMRGWDGFGNSYCSECCSVRRMLGAEQPVQNFELSVPDAGGESVELEVAILPVDGVGDSRFTVVHILRPARDCDAYDDDVDSAEASDRAQQVVALDQDVCGKSLEHQALTTREVEVLRHLSVGRSNKNIANTLGISLTTVRSHTRNILRKLGVHNVRRAISVARRHGMNH